MGTSVAATASGPTLRGERQLLSPRLEGAD